MPDMLTKDNFVPYLEKVFKVRDGRHALLLTAVDDHQVTEADLPKVNRMPFTLIFRGPPGDLLPEGLVTVDVEGEDTAFDLYLMPVHTPWADRQNYQASFN